METQIIQQCVDYFANGGPKEWVVGGVTILFLLIPHFTKWNIPDFVKRMKASINYRKRPSS